jgi:hypothetical protein
MSQGSHSMKAAAQNRLSVAKTLSLEDKKMLALEALQQNKNITELSKANKVSRKFIYTQKNKTTAAINDAFSLADNDETILYYLPVKKSWIKQAVLSLALDCRGCFRGIIRSVKSLFNYDISIGSVSSIVKDKIYNAVEINQQQDLSKINLGAIDELYHYNKPVLTGVDTRSLYCFLLAQEDSADENSWGTHLLDLKQQQLNPDRFIADDGTGLHAGLSVSYPTTPCDMDNFHLSKKLMELRRFFRNRLKSAITYYEEIKRKMEKAKASGNTHQYCKKLGLAKQHRNKMHTLSKNIDILISWMEHDVLNKAGPNLTAREVLYDFVVSEFEKLQAIHSHRIKDVVTYLKNQKNYALGFVDVLATKFEAIANKLNCSVELVWKVCELQRCDNAGAKYAIKILEFYSVIGESFEAIEDAVIEAMQSTERTSSMVENLNGRIRPYFNLRQEIGHGYLDLLRFYLNHIEFTRSEREHRVKKSPTQMLTGKKHSHWLELLGFDLFKRAA